MTTEQIIVDEITRVAAEQKKTLGLLKDETDLVSIGLDSLCFAILVARLEEMFHFDPFNMEHTQLPVTLGDLIALYAPHAANRSRPRWSGSWTAGQAETETPGKGRDAP